MSGQERKWCAACRKRRYPTEDMAARRAARFGPTKVAYRCPVGWGWHFGEDYRAVRHG